MNNLLLNNEEQPLEVTVLELPNMKVVERFYPNRTIRYCTKKKGTVNGKPMWYFMFESSSREEQEAFARKLQSLVIN